jgi:hypothetical protein
MGEMGNDLCHEPLVTWRKSIKLLREQAWVLPPRRSHMSGGLLHLIHCKNHKSHKAHSPDHVQALKKKKYIYIYIYIYTYSFTDASAGK